MHNIDTLQVTTTHIANTAIRSLLSLVPNLRQFLGGVSHFQDPTGLLEHLMERYGENLETLLINYSEGRPESVDESIVVWDQIERLIQLPNIRNVTVHEDRIGLNLPLIPSTSSYILENDRITDLDLIMHSLALFLIELKMPELKILTTIIHPTTTFTHLKRLETLNLKLTASQAKNVTKLLPPQIKGLYLEFRKLERDDDMNGIQLDVQLEHLSYLKLGNLPASRLTLNCPQLEELTITAATNIPECTWAVPRLRSVNIHASNTVVDSFFRLVEQLSELRTLVLKCDDALDYAKPIVNALVVDCAFDTLETLRLELFHFQNLTANFSMFNVDLQPFFETFGTTLPNLVNLYMTQADMLIGFVHANNSWTVAHPSLLEMRLDAPGLPQLIVNCPKLIMLDLKDLEVHEFLSFPPRMSQHITDPQICIEQCPSLRFYGMRTFVIGPNIALKHPSIQEVIFERCGAEEVIELTMDLPSLARLEIITRPNPEDPTAAPISLTRKGDKWPQLRTVKLSSCLEHSVGEVLKMGAPTDSLKFDYIVPPDHRMLDMLDERCSIQ